MVSIHSIVLTDGRAAVSLEGMIQTSTPSLSPATLRLTPVQPDAWLAWRPEAPEQAMLLSVAELDECRCPDLCNRDHANE